MLFDIYDPSSRNAGNPKYIQVTGHPEMIWNGIYTQSIRDWNNFVHFEKEI